MQEWNEINGDLIKLSKQGEFDLIAHGCNCKKKMGKGLAKKIRSAYPLAYEVDKNTRSYMGEISVCKDYEECIVINAYTQHDKGDDGHGKDTNKGRYEAIRDCMFRINRKYKGKHIGLPLIGCGLAGLKWSNVKKIMKQELTDMKVTIVRYEKR